MSEEKKLERGEFLDKSDVPSEDAAFWQERVFKDALMESLLSRVETGETIPADTEEENGESEAPFVQEFAQAAEIPLPANGEIPPLPPVPEDALLEELPPEPLEAAVQESKGQELYEWTQALVCAVLAVVLLFTFVVRLIGVDGHSMVPTLQHGDRLLVVTSFLDRDFQAGDIVVARKESFLKDPIVKRVIATGGQTVDIDFETGSVYVDDQILDEPYINELTYLEEGTEFPLTVPEGCVFLMGDNRNRSNDSRDSSLGTVNEGYIIGKATVLLFPGKDEMTERRDYSRIGLLNR